MTTTVQDKDGRRLVVGDEVITHDGLFVEGQCIVADLDHGFITDIRPDGLLQIEQWAEHGGKIIAHPSHFRYLPPS